MGGTRSIFVLAQKTRLMASLYNFDLICCILQFRSKNNLFPAYRYHVQRFHIRSPCDPLQLRPMLCNIPTTTWNDLRLLSSPGRC